MMKDPSHAYEFLCICNPLERNNDAYDDEDTEEEEDDDDASNETGRPNRKTCDKGKTCPCGKPATSLPSHQCIMTRAGLSRNSMASDMINLRNPDTFDMYTFNDHMAYGAVEVVQNLLLDFDEAYTAQNWRVAWAVVEGMAIFMLVGEGDAMCMADDGERIEQTAAQMARMVLAALAGLDSQGQLTDNSETKNVGWVMSLYMDLLKMMQGQGLLEDANPSKAKTFKFCAANLDVYLKTYARQRGITVPGVEDVSEDADVTMPRLTANDPWGWAKSFSDYKGDNAVPEYAFRGSHRGGIGGDALDISTWSSAERKRHSFNKKDPLPRNLIKNLKEGFVLALA